MKGIDKSAQLSGLDPDTLRQHIDRVNDAKLDEAANMASNDKGLSSLEDSAQQTEALKTPGGK